MNEELVAKFCKERGITLSQFFGKEKIKRSLYWDDVSELPEGVNLIVGGNIELKRLTTLPKGASLTADGCISAASVTIIPKGVTLIAGGSISLSELTELIEGVILIAECSIFLSGVTELPKGGTIIVGGDLYLNRLITLPKGLNLVVGGNIYLRGLTTIREGISITAGGNIFLNRLIILPKGVSVTAGGSLYLSDRLHTETNKLDFNKPLEWLDGKYILADSILTEVVNRKGNVWRVRKIASEKIFYLVTDGNGKFAHGGTLAQAREDLLYKIVNRDKSKYEELTLESCVQFAEGVEMYRVITGACESETKEFVKSNRIENKSYSVQEIIEMSRGRYGNSTFENFFIEKGSQEI